MRIKPSTSQFSASVNIERDADRELIYYPTENTKRIFQQIVNDYKLGIHVFTIIGSYGTGKSSFLWAFEQNLRNNKPYFNTSHIDYDSIEVLRVVGDFSSLITKFSEVINAAPVATAQELFADFFYKYQQPLKNGVVVLIIDEFGKHLEYAANNNPEKELYFIQQLAEFAADPKHNLILLSTIHQNFDAYALGLTNSQRQEWSKVKGRFRELTFNEPITQLLRLAADHIRAVADERTADDEMLALHMADLFRRSKAFELSNDILSDLSLDLLPLDLFSANVLTIALQRYGQNERSLFSFLSASDHTSLLKVVRKGQFYNLSHVYDYLLFNFYSYIQSKYNPDFSAWKTIRNGLDEIERTFDSEIEEMSSLIKAIGLFDLTVSQGSSLGESFLVQYGKLCLNIKGIESLLEKLKQKNIIIYREHLQRYVLNQGTSLDVEAALIEAAMKVEKVTDVSTLLKRYYSLPPVLAKSYSYETGTPRIFEFIITDKLRTDHPSGEIDGYIYLVFSEQLNIEMIKAHSNKYPNEPFVYIYYENSKSIRELLFELEKLHKVKEENSEDKEALRLLNESFEASKRALNYFIIGSLNSENQNLKWIWNGKEQAVANKRSFNQLLSVICKAAYPFTPTFNNELVNKHKISASINTARKNYFKALVNNWNKPDLGFSKDKFPPEKTIYLSLFKENKIAIETGDLNVKDDKNNITPLWNVSCEFLESTKEKRRNLKEFSEILSAKPFKLKQGLISFWLPSFIFIKRDEFALFGENGYIPFITDEIIDLIIRYPEKYEIKAFNIEGLRLQLFNHYRDFLQQTTVENFDNGIFIETIRPFLSFYRRLPDFTRTTHANLSDTAIAFRNVISGSEDLERTFFEDFPQALGYSFKLLADTPSVIEEYVEKLEKSIQELRDCFPNLVSRFEHLIIDRTVGRKTEFGEYKNLLANRYKQLETLILSDEHKSFIQRILSKIEDKNAWLASLAQALTGKPLEAFNDNDESVLHANFLKMIAELDKLSDLTDESYDINIEDVLGFEINSLMDGVEKTVIRMPKSKRDEIKKVQDGLKNSMNSLGGDQQMNIVALANLIKELIRS